MEKLKMLVENSLAIRAIDNSPDWEVMLSVDSYWVAVGFILPQEGENGKRHPFQFSSITWNEMEQSILEKN